MPLKEKPAFAPATSLKDYGRREELKSINAVPKVMEKVELNRIYQGDTLEVLKTWPDNFIDLIITSPPYYGLRRYGDYKEQIGLEPTFAEYMGKILAITKELKRVLKPSGQLWWNMGDCYGSHTFGNSKLAGGIQKKLCQKAEGFPRGMNKAKTLGDKCLGMMPERISIKMIDEQGWILRNKIKWAKQVLIKKENRTIGSVMPTSVKDRFNESGEELYFFVKNKKYYSDLDAVRLKPQTFENRPDGIIREREFGYNTEYPEARNPKFNYRVRDAKRKAGQPQFKASEEEIKRYNQIPEDYGKKKLQTLPDKGKTLNRWMSGTPNFVKQKSLEARMEDTKNKNQKEYNSLGKNLPTVWLIGSEPHNFQKEGFSDDTDHFAVFPKALVEIPIKFGTQKGGLVLDPFSGSGTTLIVARELGRNFLGIELNQKYIEISKKRMSQEILL